MPKKSRYNLSMKIRTILVLLLVAFAAVTLAGCNFNNNYLVKNAKLADVETILKDYAGLSGYSITYANDATGAYRVVVQRALVRSTTSTLLPDYGMRPERPQLERQVASLAIQMSQQNGDVLINAQSTGELDASSQYAAFLDFLKSKGYPVQQLND